MATKIQIKATPNELQAMIQNGEKWYLSGAGTHYKATQCIWSDDQMIATPYDFESELGYEITPEDEIPEDEGNKSYMIEVEL